MELSCGFRSVAFLGLTAVYAVVDFLDKVRFRLLLLSVSMERSRQSLNAGSHAIQSCLIIDTADNLRHG